MTFLKPFRFLALAMLLVASVSCKKMVENLVKPTVPIDEFGFANYYIKKGNQSAENTGYKSVTSNEMKFIVRFDQSAVYSVNNPENQSDVNKLYGFSDNHAAHHQFSARFGWRYMNNQLTLHAYVYNNEQRTEQLISAIEIGKEYSCSIQAAGNQYIFKAAGKTVTIPRLATGANVDGYKLFPYFGGNETAPHDIHIFIKDI